MRITFKLIFVGMLFMTMSAYSQLLFNYNDKHPTDTKLLEIFNKNENSFDKLIEMSNTDSNVIRIAYDFTRLETNWDWPRPDSQLGFTRERWDEYRSLFRKLELKSGLYRDNNSNAPIVLLTASSIGMTFRGSSKGFAYSKQALSPVLESLDQKESLSPQNKEHGTVFRKIKEDWYLYFDW
jgi:hypothetical protein